jgi:alpha-1,2-mannosyltransferase
MSNRARAVLLAILAAAAVWHLFVLIAPEKQKSPRDSAGRDFASYYYGAVVAEEGGDPYDRQAILDAAAEEGLRANVHPFFYPPPYLLVVAWAPAVDLLTGFEIWKILDEIATLLCGVALWAWWRDLGRREGSDLGEVVVPSAIALLIALLYPVAYGHQMGQANFLVLLAAVVGLSQDQKRPILAGIAMGVACMLKMSPALFVLWWAMHRNWKAVGAAVATGIALSLAVLPICGLASQLHFYTQILPEFGTGNYNGLTIRIDMFGNHSLPNIYEQLWPGDQTRLSPPAQIASTASAIALIGGIAFLFRKPGVDPLARAAQASAIAATTLLVPVYTYEHHLVWAIPGVVLAIVAAWQRRLPPAFWVPLGVAIAALCYPLPDLKDLSTTLLGGPIGWLVQESKFFAIWVVLAACGYVGCGPRRAV